MNIFAFDAFVLATDKRLWYKKNENNENVKRKCCSRLYCFVVGARSLDRVCSMTRLVGCKKSKGFYLTHFPVQNSRVFFVFFCFCFLNRVTVSVGLWLYLYLCPTSVSLGVRLSLFVVSESFCRLVTFPFVSNQCFCMFKIFPFCVQRKFR